MSQNTTFPDAITNLVGPTVTLGPIPEESLALFYRWFNDFDVGLLDSGLPMPVSLPTARDQVQTFTKPDQGTIYFAMYEKANMRLIGFKELRHIDYRHRAAVLGIAIGEKDCWGKGYGTEAMYLALDYAFNLLGLHNILLDTNGCNTRAQHVYQKIGFKEIGRRREAYRVGGRLYDVIFMDILSNDFQSPLSSTADVVTGNEAIGEG